MLRKTQMAKALRMEHFLRTGKVPRRRYEAPAILDTQGGVIDVADEDWDVYYAARAKRALLGLGLVLLSGCLTATPQPTPGESNGGGAGDGSYVTVRFVEAGDPTVTAADQECLKTEPACYCFQVRAERDGYDPPICSDAAVEDVPL